jgi:gliding motility-associated-like protein
MKQVFVILSLVLSVIITGNKAFADQNPFDSNRAFVENKGQVSDDKGNPRPEVLFKSKNDNATIFFRKDGLVYLFNRFETVPNEESRKEWQEKNNMRAQVLETKPMIFRLDMNFLNTNSQVKVTGDSKKQDFSNYYYGHCPQGIINVAHFEKIIYNNIYPNIDVVYYYTQNGLKYDVIVHPGGKLSDVKFRYDGASRTEINEEGQLVVHFADGEQIVEDRPVVYFENSNEIVSDILFSIDPLTGSIGYSSPHDIYSNTLIVDPSVTWATYFYNAASSNSSFTNPEYDASGNLFMAVQTYDNTFPTVNPGGGAYYDGTKTTMIKVAVLKFNTNRTLVWSTYYGGDKMTCLAGCTDYGKALALDNSGNVFIAGYTDPGTTVFPTLNMSGSFYQDQSKCYGETSFFVKFDNNGVRQWASVFQHEQANTNGTMMRVNGISCDGTWLYFTGQQYNWYPANTIPLRNPGGSAHYQTTILGDQDVFVGRFAASNCALNWCTYLHSTNSANTAYGQGTDLHVDASGNLWVVGRESGTNSHHYLINPGGSAYYQSTKGANGDVWIAKFNSSMTCVYGTYYGGNGMDIPSTVEPDAAGNTYIIGRYTASTDFPVQNPGGGALYQGTKSNAAADAFLLKFNSAGVRQWGTYLGANVPTAGSDENHFAGIAVNMSTNGFFLTGHTKSTSMTTLNKVGSYFQASNAGNLDKFFYEFNSAGVVQWATYYGGANSESAYNGRMGMKTGGCGPVFMTFLYAQTQTLSTVNPGGSAWYQNTTPYTYTDFLLEMGDVTAPSPVSVSISAASNPSCAGASVTFTATPTNGGATPTYQWYLNGSPVGSNSSTYSNSSLSSGNTVYCVLTSSLTCTSGNPATSNTITMTINPLPTAPTGVSATSTIICAGQSTTLSYSGGSGTTFNWYSGSCGGTSVGTGNNLSVSPATTTTYYGAWTNSCGTSSCQSVTITVNPLPVAATSATATSTTICAGQSTSLQYTGGSGTTFNWYTGSCGGTLIGSGNNLSVSPGSTTTYYGAWTNGCGTSTCQSVTITVNPLPVAPTSVSASPNPICAGQSTTLSYSGGSGTTFRWMTGSCGGTSVGTGNNLSVSPATTTTYYGRWENSCGNSTCQSVTVTVNPLPVAPTSVSASPNPICAGQSTTLSYSGGSGTTFRWMTGSCGGTSVGAGNNLSVSPATTTTYYGRWENSCGNSTCQSVTVTVNPLPVAPTSVSASPNPICAGQSTTLSYSGGSGTTFRWMTGSCGGTSVGTGNNLSVSPATTTTYYGRWENSCGNSTCQSVTVTVNPLPVAPTSVSATSSTICAGQSTTLSYSGGSGTTFNWYSGSCGGTSVGTGNNLSVSPSATTTYYGAWTNGCGTSTCQSVTITVNPLPVAPTSATATSTTICAGQSTTLSYSGGSGTTFNWYTGSCGGTLIGSGNNLSVSPGSTTTYYGAWTNGCGTSTCRSVTITVNPLPVAPTSVSASPNPICAGQSTTLSYTGGSGTTFRWMTGSCGGTSVGTGNNLSVSPATTTTYYGRWENGCGNSTCQSVTVTVNPLPVAPTSVTATSSTICAGQSTTLSYSGGSGTTFNWYSGSCGGTSVGTGNNLSVSPSATTTYYGAWTNGCGTSSCQSVTITVNPLPVAPTSAGATAATICNGQSTTLTYSGGSGTTFNWYTGSCGGTLAGTGNNLSVSPSATTTYYGAWTNGCGTSTCQSVTITVNPLPVAPTSATATSTTICAGQSTSLQYTGGSGTTFNWYTGSCGGTLIGSGNNLSVSPGSTTTYYGAWTNGCGTSTCQSVTITVNPLPVAPTSVSASVNPICAGQSTTLSYTGGSGTTFRWMTGSCGGTSVGTGNNLSVSPATTTTYYGRWENSCGNSACQSVTVTVNTESTAPSSISASNNNICSGTTVTLTLSGGSLGTGASWYWYAGSCGGTAIGSGSTTLNVTPTATSTYYVRAEGTCNNTTCASVTVTVNTNSSAPASITATQTTICAGSPVDLTVSGGILGTGATWEWYSGTCGGTHIGTGTTITVSPTVTTQYFVRAEETCGNTNCASITIQVNDNSVAPAAINASSTFVCSGTGVNLSVSGGSLGTGASWNWYTGTCGGTPVATGGTITVNPTVNTSYFVRAEGTCNTTGCAQIDITIKDPSVAATSITAVPNSICQSQSSTLTLNGGSLGTGAAWQWYSGSCGGAAAGTGTSIVVNPAVTTTYYVRAEGDCNTTICQSVQVNVIPAPDPGLDASHTVCSSDGPVNLFSYLGGSPDAGGMWLNPNSVQVAQPIDPATALQGVYLYIVSGTDPCLADTAELDLTILEAPKLDSIIVTANTMCNAPYNGEAEFHVTGSSGPFDYAIDGGTAQAGSVFTGLTAGSHTYIITGTNSCAINGSFTITSNTGFVIDSVISQNIACNGDMNGSIEIFAVDAVSYSINNGVSYEATSSYTGLDAGMYSIIVVNSGNCQAVSSVTITQPLALITDTLVSPAVCGPTGSAQIICYGGTPPYQYLWDGGSSSQMLTGQIPGTYQVTVTDQNGCTINTSATIGSLPGTGTASVTSFAHVACNGEANGSITAAMNFGIGPYSYNWSHDAMLDTITAGGLVAGTYLVTITDAYGCVAETQFTITEPAVLTASTNINDATCGPTGSVTVTPSGGTSPYQYNWSNGGNTSLISGLSAGNYAVTVTDNHGCTLTFDSLEVEDLGGSGSASVTNIHNISCQGMSDGSITVSMPLGVPPITYVWSHNASLNAPTATGLGPGIYYVTVSDSYGCSAVVNATITEPAALSGIYVTSNVICYGTSTGGVDLTVSGGTQPYFYSWSNIVTTEDLTDVPTGYYSVTVTDNNGCTWTASNILVRDASEIIPDYTVSHVACNGGNTGNISVSIIGGTAPYSATWSNGATGLTNGALAAGTYYVTISDQNNCNVLDTITLIQAPAMNGSLAIVHPQCHNSPTGEITVTAGGGFPPYTYEWSHSISAGDSVAGGLLFGQYTVTVVDMYGCEYSLSGEVFNSDNICLVIPDVFTPNGDGVNETFEILGIEAFPEAIMQIYNRWGDLLFKSTLINEFWNGTWNGEPVPMGPYVFILDLRNGEKPIQGVVTVVY